MKNFRRRMLLVGATGLSTVMLANAASAQDQVVVPAQSVEPQGAVGGNATDIIVVTAQKRSVDVQKIPAAVAVYSGEALLASKVTAFDQLYAIDPALSIERGEGGNALVSIRGFGTTPAGQSFEQSVAPYINGVYAGGNIREFQTPLYDIERVEVLKGTQSGITGQNTSVGAMNIVTRQAGSTFSGYLRAGREFRYDGWNAEGAINLPASQDLSVRLSGFFEDLGGYLKNIVTGNRPGSGRTYSGRVNVKWDASDIVTVRLYGQYDNSRSLGSPYVTFGTVSPYIASVIPDVGSQTTTTAKFSSRSDNGGDAGFHYDNLRGSIAIDVDLGGPTLTSVTAASRLNDTLTVDPDQSPLDAQWLYQKSRYSQVHQEVRLVSPSNDRLTYIVGGWFRHAKTDKIASIFLDNPAPAPSFRADLPFLQKTDTFSVFGDVGYKLTDALTVGGSLRFTSETKRAVAESISNWPVAFTAFPLSRGKLTPNFLDGSARIQYQVTPDIMLFGVVAKGTKTGAYLDLANEFASVRPEKATTYEIGTKARFPDAGLTVNASLFHLNVKDYQDSFTEVIGGSVRFTTQNRDVYTQGVEFDINWKPTPQLSLGLSGTGMDSRDKTGGRAVRAPHWSLNGNFRYELPLGTPDTTLALFGSANYRSLYYTIPESSGPSSQATATPKYALLNLGVDAKLPGGFSAQFLVKNVTSAHTHLGVQTLSNDPSQLLGIQMPLRQFYLTLGYDF